MLGVLGGPAMTGKLMTHEELDDPQTKIRKQRLEAARRYLGPEMARCEPAWKQDMRDVIHLHDDLAREAERLRGEIATQAKTIDGWIDHAAERDAAIRELRGEMDRLKGLLEEVISEEDLHEYCVDARGLPLDCPARCLGCRIRKALGKDPDDG